MKLAEEIAKDVFDRLEMDPLGAGAIVPTIVAKLEPVKDALKGVIDYAGLTDEPCLATSMLALLSEEE